MYIYIYVYTIAQIRSRISRAIFRPLIDTGRPGSERGRLSRFIKGGCTGNRV